jgi:hypothetical protein
MPVLVVAGLVNPVSLAPTLLTPANGTYLDLSNQPTFTWQYNPGQTGLTQSGWAFLRITNGGSIAQFWNVSTGTWQSTPVYNSGSTGSYTFPTGAISTNANMSSTLAASITNLTVLSTAGFVAGTSLAVVTSVGVATYIVSSVTSSTVAVVRFVSQTGGTGHVTTGAVTGTNSPWQDGNIYQWSIQTKDSNGVGAIAGYFTINAQVAPSVTVTAPSGSIATADPLITWTLTLAPGAQQTSYRVIVYNITSGGSPTLPSAINTTDGSTSVYDSGQLGGSYVYSLDLSAVPIYLPSGISWRAYVAVTETGGQWSGWSHSSFSTSYTPPTTPTIVATQTTDVLGSACPIISLLVTGANTPYNGLQNAIILRNGSDGSSVYVRNASPVNPAPIPGTSPYQVIVEDFEVIPGVQYTYVASIIVITGTNASVISATASSSAVHFVTTKCWAFNPLNPSATAIAAQAIQWEPQVTEQSTAHLVMGQSPPNIVASTIGGLDGQGTFETFDQPTYLGLQALLNSQATVFISLPFGGTDSGFFRIGPQTGGMSTGTGNKTLDSTLLPSTIVNMHRTTAITFVSQSRPPV